MELEDELLLLLPLLPEEAVTRAKTEARGTESGAEATRVRRWAKREGEEDVMRFVGAMAVGCAQ
jgi:hypothetical protein